MAHLYRLQHLLTAVLLAAAMVFIMPNDSNAQDTITTSSGLRYVDNAPGAGEAAKAGDKVVVHYTGWLTTGKPFERSRKKDKPFTFDMGRRKVIRGWDEGVMSMKVGGLRQSQGSLRPRLWRRRVATRHWAECGATLRSRTISERIGS